ncbi:NB-ARC domains-containing protein [Tanacetum coccineum]
MKVIVKGEEECDAIVNATVVFPCLKSLTLDYVTSLEGFCLGKEGFEFPSLDTLKIDGCREMTVFTKGDLSTPKLHAIRAKNGKFNIHNRLNSVGIRYTQSHLVTKKRPTTKGSVNCLIMEYIAAEIVKHDRCSRKFGYEVCFLDNSMQFVGLKEFERYEQRAQIADIFHVKIMRNNMFVTVTDSKGNMKMGASSEDVRRVAKSMGLK